MSDGQVVGFDEVARYTSDELTTILEIEALARPDRRPRLRRAVRPPRHDDLPAGEG